MRANDQGDVLAYSLGGEVEDAGLFDIDIATGQLKTKEKLNREATGGNERTVTVTAVDPFGRTDTATVTIEIENEDERPTINERTAKTMLKYSEPVGATVTADTPAPVLLWTYAATDDEDDAAADTDLKWKLEGADRSKLTIGNTVADRGQLKFMKNPDFEKPVDANKNNVYRGDRGGHRLRQTHRHAGRESGGNERQRGWRGDLHSGYAPGWGAADRHAGGP